MINFSHYGQYLQKVSAYPDKTISTRIYLDGSLLIVILSYPNQFILTYPEFLTLSLIKFLSMRIYPSCSVGFSFSVIFTI
jgi:hypothetical protein